MQENYEGIKRRKTKSVFEWVAVVVVRHYFLGYSEWLSVEILQHEQFVVVISINTFFHC